MKNISLDNFWRSLRGFGLVGLMVTALGWNQPGAVAQPRLNCNNPQTQAEMNACAGQRWQAGASNSWGILPVRVCIGSRFRGGFGVK
jgi:hypothetical protein